MPKPVVVGALITVNHVERRLTPEEGSRIGDPGASFCARLFAKLDTGDVVFGPFPGMGLGLPSHEISDIDLGTFAAFVAENVAMRPPPHLAEHADVYMERWDQVAAALAELGVAARAEDLLEMPFETIVDSEVRALLGEA